MKNSLNKSLYFKSRIFQAGELAAALRQLWVAYAKAPDQATVSVSQLLADGSTLYKGKATAEDIESICNLSETTIKSSFDTADDSHISFSIHQVGVVATLCLDVRADSASHLNEVSARLQQALALEVADEPYASPYSSIQERLTTVIENIEALRRSDQDQPSLSDRVARLEEAILASRRTLKCFLSYRFVPEDELAALRIRQFLMLLDIDVVTGVSYEPRRVQEKVLARLQQPLDFIVLLVTVRGESMWTRDEIGAAIHNDLAIIPLVERGAKFKPGLFGDIEYVEYESGHIGDVFLKLLEAVHFLRGQKIASTRPRNDPSNKGVGLTAAKTAAAGDA